jgi:hypothetical protein
MKKKYIIAVSVVVALWGGFMAYRYFKGKQDTEEFQSKEYSRMTVAAKQSPRAGLSQMARALEKFQAEKGSYPSNLKELYPTYLANKSFIEDIDWYYEPRGQNFFLSKTVVRDNRRMVASIDKSLMPKLDTGVMVAAPTPTAEPGEVKGPEGVPAERPEISVRSREEFWEALRLKEKGLGSLPKSYERKVIASIRPEIVSVVEPEVDLSVEAELSQRYLVWKDDRGTLGFGDVQYPAGERQNIYAMGSWYDIKVPLPGEEGLVTLETEGAEGKEGLEVVASNLSGQYLVWKSGQDIIGFGNVEYPERDQVAVFQDDSWVGVEKPPVPADIGAKEDLRPQEGKSAETIASGLSTRYMVWKDEGTLGFGNVGYPERERVSVFQDDSWVGVEKPPVPADIGAKEDLRPQEGKSAETISSGLSNRYLVWKDENGTLGFGNVEYPEVKNISRVSVDGSWEKVTN